MAVPVVAIEKDCSGFKAQNHRRGWDMMERLAGFLARGEMLLSELEKLEKRHAKNF
jgi:hypothetical protein